MKNEKVRIYPGEEFREIETDYSLKLRYAISNLGRMVSFTDKIENGRLLKGTMLQGYKIFRFKIYRDGKMINSHFFYYKLVAKYFITKTNENQEYIIHLDYCRSNDHTQNLKWVSADERLEHFRKSPHVIEARKNFIEFNRNGINSKLTSTRVMMIKKLLANPNRKTRIKMIAKQFGVSEMQIFRIKSGENWGHVKI
ncbi:MAG: NUMOD4 domain-containing protein [Lentimicrobiaceae bacterium]|jgi:hypothetical protein